MWAYGVDKEKLKEIQSVRLEDRIPSLGIKKLDVPIPTLKPDEVLIKPKYSALNFNSLWSSVGYPVTPFQLISGHVSRNPADKDHLLDYAIFGSDCSGTIVNVGTNVQNWSINDEVVVHCNVINSLDPIIENDSMKSATQSIWGYETNFGAFAEYCKVKAGQLLPKPVSVDWPHAASYCLTHSTAYRMLISDNGANLKAGETCLIWGAAGGLGTFAIQLCKLAGVRCVAVVSSEEKAKICKELGADIVIDRSKSAFGPFRDNTGKQDKLAWAKGKKLLASLGVKNIDVVFEHVGAATLGASIYFLKKGGRVVICAASSGYDAEVDLRYLWMEVKTVIGSHFANYSEAQNASNLVASGQVVPKIYGIYEISKLGQLMDEMFLGKTFGKIVFRH
jgi:crotonyl-CoA reductase